MSDNLDSIREKMSSQTAQAETSQYLTFCVNNEEFGVDIMLVREIKGWTSVTRLPNTPAYMRGVMNLRGVIVPIFDLKCRFTGNNADITANSVIIILAVNERNIGILVDSVSDIVNVANEEVRPAPQIENQPEAAYISGLLSLDKRMVVLLEMQKIFDSKDLGHAQQIA